MSHPISYCWRHVLTKKSNDYLTASCVTGRSIPQRKTIPGVKAA